MHQPVEISESDVKLSMAIRCLEVISESICISVAYDWAPDMVAEMNEKIMEVADSTVSALKGRVEV